MITNTKFKPIAVLACMILVLLALFCLGNTEADAATYSGSCGTNVTWSLDTDTGVLNITGSGAMKNYSYSSSAPWSSYKSSIKTVKIGDSVTTIGSYAFYGCSSLTGVTIGDNVTSIGSYAFSDCTSLKSVTIGDSVTYIGSDAFSDCSSLTSVTIGDSVTSIGPYAFYGCSSLTGVTIGDSVTSIGYDAFRGCFSLTSVTIGDSVTSIGSYAFYNCDSLTSVTIPDSVTSIGDETFRNCPSLTSVYITDIAAWCGIAFGDSYSNPLYYATELYVNGELATEIIIPDGVTSIPVYAFSCPTIKKVTIPDSVTSIGDSAFSYCTSLTSIAVSVKNTSYKSIDGNLYSKDGKTLIQYAIGKTATSFTIPDSVTSINSYAFSYCESLTSVTIGDNVTTICSYAFSYCTSLTSVTIGDSVTSIGDYAFYNTGYYNNNSNWENGVLYIGKYLIKAKTNISGSYSIKAGTKVIADEAFYNCTSLTSVTIPDSVTSIGYHAFYKCTSLTGVTFKATEGWWYASSYTATSGTTLSAADLANTSTAAKYLTSNYYDYYWHRNVHTHEYTATVTAPTCTEKGYTTYLCECGDTYVGNEVAALGHDYTAVVTAPTCIAEGFTTYTCACGDSYVGDYTAMTQHNYVYHSMQAPTCTVDGYVLSKCSTAGCTAEIKVTIPATGSHTPSAPVVTEPTCTEGGYTTYVCAVCRETYVGDETEPTGHSYNSTVTDPTCTEKGYTTYLCECGDTYTDNEIAALGHDYEAVVTAPTCTEGGYTTYTCSNCGDSYVDNEIEALGHNYNAVVTVPTCTNEGYTTYTCTVCGDSYVSDEVAALGHNYLSFTTEPTCTEKGFTTYICIVCRYGYNGDHMDMLPHEYGEDGYCDACGAKEMIADGLFAWQLSKDGVLTISGKGAMPNYNVDEVPWADYRTMIVRIEIGEGITTVGRCAFYGCVTLREVTLPSTLTEIKEYGFYGCSSLNEITVPAAVNTIGKYAFRRAGLEKVTFETLYGWSAGENVLTATEVYGLGAGYLTKNYYKLDWVRDINADPEEINPNFVAGGACNTAVKWELVYIDEAKTQMKLIISGNGAMPEYGTGAAPWYGYLDSIVEIEVSEGVTTVGRCAFYGLKNVTKVTLRDGLTKIGDYAFNGCKALTEIDVPESVTAIGKDAFAKTGLAVIPTV